MPHDPAFDELMARLRRGEEAAAVQVFQRFARRLLALARHRLDAGLRAKMDPEDLMQSALKSFFARHANGEFDLDGWDSLGALLTTIVLRKCGYQLRRFRAACRDVQREVAPPAGGDDTDPLWEALARDPTPEEAARLEELVEHLLHGLAERERQIVVLSLQGCSVAAISEQVGCGVRKVYRLQEHLREYLERLRDADA